MKNEIAYEEALRVALGLRTALEDYCERIEIAGSLRRKRPLVSDIELVFIPKMEERADGLFDRKPFDLAHEAIERMLVCGMLAKRRSVAAAGVIGWGMKNKMAV